MRAWLAIAIVAAFLPVACSDDPTSTTPAPPPATSKAVYVLNEGQFGDPAGARLTMYDKERDTVYTDVYESSNAGAHLGSLGDDMALHGGKAYIVMSGSHDLKVINTDDHRLIQSANYPGATPHDVVISADGSRMFVTMLYSDSILSIDPTILAVRRTLYAGPNPQGMAIAGLRLFVCNSGFGSGRTVSVFNIDSEQLLTTIDLHDGPSGVACAPDGRVWVVCAGNPYLAVPTSGRVYVLDGSSLTVQDSVVFDGSLFGPIALSDDGYAYVLGVTPGDFFGGPVHRITMSGLALSLNHVAGTYYSLACEPGTSDLYLADAKSFTGTGEISVITPAGAVREKFDAQRGPGKIAFKF
jgi:DNA-binding beta-propeller fold protein YncE